MSAYRDITEELTVSNATSETAEFLKEVKVFFDRMCDFTKPLVADWDSDDDKVINLVEDNYYMRLVKIVLTVDGETVEIHEVRSMKSLSDLAKKIPGCTQLYYFGQYTYNWWNDDRFEDATCHFAQWLEDEEEALKNNVTFKGFVRDDGSMDNELTITAFDKENGLRTGDELFSEGIATVEHINKWTTIHFFVCCCHPEDLDPETASAIKRCVMEIAAYDKVGNTFSSDTDEGTVGFIWSQNAEFTREELPVFVEKLKELAEKIEPVGDLGDMAGTFEANDSDNTPFAVLRIDFDGNFNVRVRSALL